MTEWKAIEYSEEIVIEMDDGEKIVLPYEGQKEKWVKIARQIVTAVNFCETLRWNYTVD